MTTKIIDTIDVSKLRDKHDSAPVRWTGAWATFLAAFTKPRRTVCTVVTCKHNDCTHKNGRAWSPALFPPKTRRQKKFVDVVTVLVIDLDHVESDHALRAQLNRLAGLQHFVHASHSDRPSGCAICTCGSEPGALHGQHCPSRVDRCVRVIIALSRPVRRDEWPRFWRAAIASLQIPADPACCDANRIYYLPSRPRDAEGYMFETRDGAPLDVDAILATAPPEAPSVATTLDVDADGGVGPGQRHAMLKSVAGALRFRGAGEQEILESLRNANQARCKPPKSDDEIESLARWAAQQPVSSLPPLEHDHEQSSDAVDPSDDEDFVRDRDGRIVPSQDNIDLALRKLGVRLRYDDFACHEIIEGLAGFGPRLDESAVNRLRFKIDAQFRFLVPKSLFFDLVSDRARLHRFHPVRRYLDGLKWDGKERISRWLIDYAGAKDTPYVRAVSRIVLVAAVRRVRHPGAKYDEMLVLESKQGADKSTGLRELAIDDDWFTDDLPLGTDTKRFMEATAGKWIVEAGELKGMSKADVASLKSCLSRQVDEARMSYDRKASVAPRQFVIIGTTNETCSYLRDATGNRRFWPVRVQRFNVERLRADRDQLWAEAAAAEASGESIRLDPSLYENAAVEQAARRSSPDDPILSLLQLHLGSRSGKIAVPDVYRLLGILPGNAKQDQISRVGQLMQEIGWERTQRRRDGGVTYCYVRGDVAEGDDDWIVVETDQFGLVNVTGGAASPATDASKQGA